MAFAKKPLHLDWDDLRVALAIGKQGSLSAAARQLRLDHSTLHRRVEKIEQRFGARLFERSRGAYQPTAAGEEVIALARRVEDEVLGLETRLAGGDRRPSGTVRVSTSDTLLLAVLTPLFAQCRKLHPEITLDVTTTALFVNLTRREADVVVRVSDTPPEHLVGRKAGVVVTRVYASRAYLEMNTSEYGWVGFGENLGHIAGAKWMQQSVPAERIVYRADTVLAMADAAKAAMGVAPLPDVLANTVAELRAVEPAPMPPIETDLWVLTHAHLRKVARVKALVEFLARGLAAVIERRGNS